MSMCVSPSFQFSTDSHCQHSFCSCSQQLQEGNWEEIATRNFLSSTHRSKADFSLQSLTSAMYSLLHLIHGHYTNADGFFFGGTGVWTTVFLHPKQVIYWFGHTPSPFSSGVSITYLLSLTFGCNPPDLSLPSYKNYWYEPPATSSTLII
jgi:hypothetical protein